MKSIKVTKNMLKMHPSDLLIKIGAVNVEKKLAYPQHVYLSKEGYKELRNNLKKQIKKEYPDATKFGFDNILGMELLNFGPNESLEEAIRPGYALVDLKEIDSTEKAEKSFNELLPEPWSSKEK